MGYSFVFESNALQEYEEAIIWYLKKSELAALNFEAEINEKLQKIILRPNVYHIAKDHLREAILNKFPYSIIYFADEDRRLIVVTSIFHSSRNPRGKYSS